MSDSDSDKQTSASGRLPNDPGPEATGGGGADDMLEENLKQQEPGAKLSKAEADYSKRAST